MALGSPQTPNDDFFYLPGLVETTYSQPGDINIGAVVNVAFGSATNPFGACSKDRFLSPMYAVKWTELIAYTTRLVNEDPKLLPNVSLGFVIRGLCPSVGVTLATSLSFLPLNMQTNCSLCSSSSHTDNQSPESDCHVTYDVIGTLGPGYSLTAVAVSSLYSVAHLPMVGISETSDDLSDKYRHPYFFRVLPPDVYQVQAILNFISANGWSYVSVLYSDGAYGQRAFDNFNRAVAGYGICIATSHRLLHDTDYKTVVSDLLIHSRARAVVLFINSFEFRSFLEAVVHHDAIGHFILLGGNSLMTYAGYEYTYEGASQDPALGAFVFGFYARPMTEFHNYLLSQWDSIHTSNNPWMRPMWEEIFGCSLDFGTCDRETIMMQSWKVKEIIGPYFAIDGVLAFAHAVHDLLTDRCPGARGQEARACITGELLRHYMKNTKFDGFHDRIEFDENQEIKGKYRINQLHYTDEAFANLEGDANSSKLVLDPFAIYDIRSNTNTYLKPILWSHLNNLDRIVPWTNGSVPMDVPESVCSGPCEVGEYKIEKDVPCCWECRRCRDNERLVDTATSCEACPLLTWPDPSSNFTTCTDIPPTYSNINDTIPKALVSLTVFVLLVYVFTCLGYIWYRHERVIKASSKELSVIQLIAVLAGYCTILLFQVEPSQNLCRCVYFLFCLSFVLLYAPLLVKTVRIFRIFQSGKTNNRQLRFISSKSQLIIVGFVVAVQVILCVGTFILFSPGARRTQPIWSEKLVELSCDLTLPGLASFLGYNIVLVCLCSVFAIKVRKLPDNFNESQFIAMCVATTLLIWLAFIPTYFTASREYVRVFLLSTALLLNHSVALIFLFLPKIYAAAFVPPETTKVTDGKS